MTDGRDRVRDGVLGAPKAAHLQVVEGGRGEKNAVPPVSGRKPRGGGRGPAAPVPADPTPENTCPLVPLGHRDGLFYFLDIKGQERKLTARSMGSRPEVSGLFVGDTSWLFRWFPRTTVVKSQDASGNDVTETKVIGFQIAAAGEFLMALCGDAGLYGPHVVLRGPGVWRDDTGAPVVHTGNRVLLEGAWRSSGFRSGDQVWTADWPAPRPGMDGADGAPLLPGERGFAAPATVAQELQARIGDLWKFRNEGSEIVVIGLMGVGYFGAAARWRPNGYLIGGTGSGKSLLLDLLRACSPSHSYSTDATKSGIENAINGRPTIAYIDEAGDRADQRGAQMLLDLVLSASGNDGTKGLRGTADGRGRAFQVLCNVIMATVNPPDMGPQHRDRFTIVDLVKPGAGEDNRALMEAAIAWAKTHARQLWGRALEGWERWQSARAAYREALAAVQCAAREMDQMGAILASWWVLTSDGAPSSAEALDGVHAVGAFIRGAIEVAQEDGPRRMLAHLATFAVQQDRSTDRELVGKLVEYAFTDDVELPTNTRRWLERYGIRVIRAGETEDRQRRPVPRLGPGDGIWFGRSMQTLTELFKGTPWEGARWTHEMLRLEGARASKRNVRIGGFSGPAIWLPRSEWDPPDD